MAGIEHAPKPRSILFESQDGAVVLVDLPTSIEEGQIPSSHLKGPSKPVGSHYRRLLSAPPVDAPFVTPEPKDGGDAASLHQSASAKIAELMAEATVTRRLNELKGLYSGLWCLARIPSPPFPLVSVAGPNVNGLTESCYIPEAATYLLGTIESQRETFISTAPKFDLIVMDPPWPNRSARRKTKGYHVTRGLPEIKALLSLIPVAAHLAPGGLVAIWVTNKQAFVHLLTSPGGIFDQWDVELVHESIWLKVTASGDPIFAVNSQWRKPWERLLVARRKRSSRESAEARTLKLPQVIVSVPDVHSRKPNLRGLFEHAGLSEPYNALEVFARNLTAGWWSWGSEVLLFQGKEHWVELDAVSVSQPPQSDVESLNGQQES